MHLNNKGKSEWLDILQIIKDKTCIQENASKYLKLLINIKEN